MIERRLDGAGEDGEELAAAFEIATLADVAPQVQRGIFARLATRPQGPVATAAERSFAQAFLGARPAYLCPDVPAELVVALARYDDLAPALFEALARTRGEPFEPALDGMLAAARRDGGAAAADALFARWVSAMLDRKAHEDLADLEDEGRFRRAVEIAIERGPAKEVLALYQEISSPARAAAFLDALERSGAHRDPALRAAATALKAWGADEDHATRYAWLRACVKER